MVYILVQVDLLNNKKIRFRLQPKTDKANLQTPSQKFISSVRIVTHFQAICKGLERCYFLCCAKNVGKKLTIHLFIARYAEKNK